MRDIMECVHKVSRMEGLAIDDFFHVAELENVQDDARSMAAKENDHDAQQNHA